MKSPIKRSAAQGFLATENSDIIRAIGYIRVSTDMQAAEGLSLEAQEAAIEQYCKLHGYRLSKICRDVLSGAKDQRRGLQEALGSLERGADVLIVLKFDRLSRSIRHFCELYERYFKDGAKELIAIRESIRLDSSLGRALVSILLVFAQMEREATGERTRETIRHIRSQGYHFGTVPYGKRAVSAPDNSRMRVLVEDAEEQAVLVQLKAWAAQGMGISEMATRLNAKGKAPPQGERWTKSVIYNLKLRLSWITPRPWNVRLHTDEEVKERMLELRSRGHTYLQIASILNTQGWLPRKGQRFTPRSVRQLLGQTKGVQLLSPRKFLENLLERMEYVHQKENPGEPFQRPGYARLATLLTEAGYVTPRGYARWWPAQVQQLLGGRFERYYAARAERVGQASPELLGQSSGADDAKQPLRVDEIEAALDATASCTARAARGTAVREPVLSSERSSTLARGRSGTTNPSAAEPRAIVVLKNAAASATARQHAAYGN